MGVSGVVAKVLCALLVHCVATEGRPVVETEFTGGDIFWWFTIGSVIRECDSGEMISN